MKIIEQSIDIQTLFDGDAILRDIELAGRVCYKSENKITDDSAQKFVKRLIASKHEAVIEFGPSITVKFTTNRGVSHELVRHRLASYAQESTRYCNYSRDKFDNQITLIRPVWVDSVVCNVDQNGWDEYGVDYNNDTGYIYNSEADKAVTFDKGTGSWLSAMGVVEHDYFEALENGWTAQQAREILPNALKTEINVKANIREWRHILKMRTAPDAHPQIRALMKILLEYFQEKIPILFDDIGA